MSPLEIEAYRGINLRVNGEGLENNPARKIDKIGEKSLVKPGKAVTLTEGELLIIPETQERSKVESEDSSLGIFRDEKYNPGAGSTVTIVIKAEGYNLSGGIEGPFASTVGSIWDRKLEKNPAVVRANNQELVKVSWRK